MMNEVTWATPLYEFLRQCNASGLEKTVLDCGAGGDRPPLSVFRQYGYACHGVEIAPTPLAQAQAFAGKYGMDLHLVQGDMRYLPHSDASFSFVYSFNAIFFNTMEGISRAMREMLRVLRGGGLCYVNFMSVDDPDDHVFCDADPCRDVLQSTRFAKHGDDEADVYFKSCEILRKEKRFVQKAFEGEMLEQVYLEYIARKR